MKKIAIVGFGPRGLSALESLFIEAFKKKLKTKFSVTIFEKSNQLGAGNIWNTKQTEVNRLNISERALADLNGRKEIKIEHLTIPCFPSYTDWLPSKDKNLKSTSADRYPPRKKLGKYLKERSDSIVNVLKEYGFLTVYNTLILDVDFKNHKSILTSLDNQKFIFDEVLITIGHQPTKISPDIEEFQIASYNKNFYCFPETYPLKNIIKSKEINSEKNIAIRGLGLSMIDAVRALTLKRGGIFIVENTTNFKSRFINSDAVPKQILPYSLDGLPMVPKPLNAELDSVFALSSTQTEYLKNQLKKVTTGQKKIKNNSFLKKIIAKISSDIYIQLKNNLNNKQSKKELENVIINWLSEPKFKHDLIESVDVKTEFLIESFVKMACGEQSISLDYCVGQVWRHCHRILYNYFSHANISEEGIASIIELDEQMKRYSYGPPVESMQQLLALVDANILNLDYCNNPEINIINKALVFSNENKKINVQVIINSVLDAPKLLEVTSPIVKNLLRHKLIEPIHSDLGIHTKKDGRIVTSDLKKNIPISVLGRLSKGSVIGTDAILECFGIKVENWANGLIKRLE